MPGAGRAQLEVLQAALGPLQVEERLLALPRLRRDVGFRGGAIRLDLLFELAEPLLGVGQRQLRLVVLDARDRVAAIDVQPGAIDVVARLHQRGRVLLLGEARLGARLLDLGVGLPQL